MVYRELSFENDLFTARVYRRNYKNSWLQHPRKQESDNKECTITPRNEKGQNTNFAVDPLALPFFRNLTTFSSFSKDVNGTEKLVEKLVHDFYGIMITRTTTISTEKRFRGLEHSGSSSTLDPYPDLR